MNKLSLLFFCFLLTPCIYGQKKLKLSTNGQGTMFVHAGYNRSAYNRSDVEFSGGNYSFSLHQPTFSDTPEGVELSRFFHSSSMETFQLNVHVGYFVDHKWALTLGYDRMNLFMQFDEPFIVSGNVAPEVHSKLSGGYDRQSVDLEEQDLNYYQDKGINFFNAGVQRTDKWYRTKDASFSVNTIAKVGVGVVFSNSTYTFDGFTTENATGLSGVGAYANAGVRFDFFQHVFFQAGVSSGILAQNNTSLRSITNETAKQNTLFFSPQIAIGLSFFVRPTNACNTCPQW